MKLVLDNQSLVMFRLGKSHSPNYSWMLRCGFDLTLFCRDLISAQRLSIEILTKLSIKHHNVDLILATRPFGRLEKLFNFLVSSLCNRLRLY